MNLNPIEWAKAQEFLLKLVQILDPFSAREPFPAGFGFFIPKHFFTPPSIEMPQIRFDARLLHTLENVSKEVDEWIEKFPDKQDENFTDNILKTEPRKENECDEKAVQFTEPKTQITAKAPFLTAVENLPKAKTSVYAQKVVEQVRQAIRVLSASSYLNDPKVEPLKEALRRLKPSIDQLIDAVLQEKPSQEETLSKTRFKTRPSERELQLRKLISFSLNKREIFLRRSFADPYLDSKSEKEPVSRFDPAAEAEPRDDKNWNDPKLPPHSIGAQGPFKNLKPEGESFPSKPAKPGIPSAAPLIPLASQSRPSSRKNRRKKHSFWLRSEEEKEKSPDS